MKESLKFFRQIIIRGRVLGLACFAGLPCANKGDSGNQPSVDAALADHGIWVK